MLTELSSDNNFNWEVELVYNPDQALADSKNIVVSSDGWVLDKAEYWYNLAGYLINGYITDANTIVV
jgi:hypothetical protein